MPSLDEAVAASTGVARFVCSLLAFCANVKTDRAELHLAYDASPEVTEREFVEVFIPDEVGSLTEGRMVDPDEAVLVFHSLANCLFYRRVAIALQQYEQALRHWRLGGEWLAVSHLWAAAEAITPSLIESECLKQGVDKESLARSAGIEVTDDSWKRDLDVWCRRELVFGGDLTVYRHAFKARNGIQHGFMAATEFVPLTEAAAEPTFGHLRRAILRLLGVGYTGREALFDRPVRDVQSLSRQIHGRVIGEAIELAPAGEEYPRLEWTSRLRTLVREDDNLQASITDQWTVRMADGLSFQGEAIRVNGRNEAGSPPLELSITEVTTRGSGEAPIDWIGLMSEAHAFADSVASGAGEVPARALLSFETVAQQLALYEACQELLSKQRPVEAFMLVHQLMRHTALLQLLRHGGSRAAQVDAQRRLAQLTRQGRRLSEPMRTGASRAAEELVQNLAAQDHAVPRGDVDLRRSPYFRENLGEIRFAEEVARAEGLAGALHLETITAGQRTFRTQSSDTKLIVGVAGDAVGALIESTVAAAAPLGWSYDPAAARALLDRAEAMNRWIEEDGSEN